MISKEEVLKIAKLARLELSDVEVEKMQKDLSAILDYFDILKKAPRAKFSEKSNLLREAKDKLLLSENVSLRKDEVIERPKNLAGDLLRLAPQSQDGYFKVKQIL